MPGRSGPSLLRFMTCGSVDDGKSTLIGRLLYETGALYDDQLAALEQDSRRHGTRGPALDFALLLDGLQAEREQGITIDVAYRFFATERRRFIVADAPGHEQYTRNMVTAASSAEVAVLLADARKGLLVQSRRHAYLAAMLGVRCLVLAVNKMDLVGCDQATFEPIRADFAQFAAGLDLPEPVCIPLSATDGDNVTGPSPRMPWYRGPTLLAHLETVEPAAVPAGGPFRLPVQLVQRPDQGFRGFSGTVAGGRVRPGDPVVVAPSGQTTAIARIVTAEGDLDEAVAGQAVTLTLADAVDVGRGDVLAAADAPPESADQFAAHLFWMDTVPLLPERQYLFRIGSQLITGQVTELKHRVNVNNLEHQAAKRLALNEIGWCSVALDRPAAFDAYAANRQTGAFIMIDRQSHRTVAGGTIAFALRRARNVTWQALTVDKAARATLKRQRPCVLWFTGLSGAGKSTIANSVEAWLTAHRHHTYLLDGDNVRHGLNRDLGFTDEDRVENVRRVAEVAKLMADAGLIVLVSLISPFRAERDMARSITAPGEFIEIHVDTPIEVCEARDPKGLYRRARAGQIKNFTGIDSSYEPPTAPELALTGDGATPEALAERVVALLEERGMLV